MRTNDNPYNSHIARDVAIIVFSVLLAVLVAKAGIVRDIIAFSQGVKFLGSFVAGIFFTSIFTVSISAVAFAEIAKANSIIPVAVLGALGACIGDMIIFKFVRDSISDDVKYMLQITREKRFSHIFHKKIFRYITPLVGALIIASPLPDEFGVALLGLSHIRVSWFVLVSFTFNFLGIMSIELLAKSFW